MSVLRMRRIDRMRREGVRTDFLAEAAVKCVSA